MLEQVLPQAAGHAEAFDCAPGVRCWELDVHPPESVELGGGVESLEALFCAAGDVRIGHNVCANRQILLLAGGERRRAELCGRRLQGVLISARTENSGGLGGLFALGQTTPEQVETVLSSHGGVYVYGQSAWSEAVFSAMRELPAGERGRYCAVKCAELLYLLCRRSERSSSERTRYRDPYLVETVRRIHAYILDNLGERLTISELSRSFRIAPTSFKECFRELYGQSVHAYILGRRMERASELLSSTNMPVFQIAEAVGYGSASQFGVEFKRRYQLSPLVYRKRRSEKIV